MLFETFLRKAYDNLNSLKEEAAEYGSNPPLDLRDRIDDVEKAIHFTERARRGELNKAEWCCKPY